MPRWTFPSRLALEMMHDRVDAIDADPGIGGFTVPQPPVQALNFPDDHCLRRLPRRIVARQSAGDLLQVLKSHADVKPVQKRRSVTSASARMRRSPEEPSVKAVSAVCSVRPTASRFRLIRPSRSDFGFGDRTENLSSTEFCFQIADAYLKMSLPGLATPDEGRIERHHDRWRRCFRRMAARPSR